MTDFPAVLVIIPYWNAAAYLPACLDSLRAATPGAFSARAVVVDDGSPDEGQDDLVRRSSEGAFIPVEYVRRDANGGPSAARNSGIDQLRGEEFTVFLDSDDALHPDFLDRMTSFLARNPRLDVARCVPARWQPATALESRPDDFEPLSHPAYRHIRRAADPEEQVVDLSDEPFNLLARVVHSAIWRSSVFDDLHFDECRRIREDVALWREFRARHGDAVGFVNRPLYLYRRRASGDSLSQLARATAGSGANGPTSATPEPASGRP